MSIEILSAIVGIISAGVATWFAIDACRKPRLSVRMVGPTGAHLPLNEVLVRKTDLRFLQGEPEPLILPLIVLNIGKKTAKNVRLVIRFPGEIKLTVPETARDARFVYNPTEYFNNHEITIAVGDLHPLEQRVLNACEVKFPAGCFYPELRHARPDDFSELHVYWVERFRVDCIAHHDDAQPTYHQLYVRTDITVPEDIRYSRPGGYMSGGFKMLSMPADTKEILATLAEKFRTIKEGDRTPVQQKLWKLLWSIEASPERYDEWLRDQLRQKQSWDTDNP
jgi:hypothetical protein